ncbi:unnamed protein product, partial [Mesorhabditis belari]|uniref:FYVE-type domain-containing protein n=1 Tax=Mesorhabditis belari TaxID=2138241 RepID=A0AAF3F473_9BILA
MEAVPSMDDLLDEAEVEVRSPGNSTFHSTLSSFSPFSTPKTHRTPQQQDEMNTPIAFKKEIDELPNQSMNKSPNHPEQVDRVLPISSELNGHSDVELLERTQDMEEENEEQIEENDEEIPVEPASSPSRTPSPEEREIVEKPKVKKSLFFQATSNQPTNEDKDFEEALAYLGIDEKLDGGQSEKSKGQAGPSKESLNVIEEVLREPTCSSKEPVESGPSEKVIDHDLYDEQPQETTKVNESSFEVEEHSTSSGYDKEEILGWVHEMIDEMIYESLKTIEFLQEEQEIEQEPLEDQIDQDSLIVSDTNEEMIVVDDQPGTSEKGVSEEKTRVQVIEVENVKIDVVNEQEENEAAEVKEEEEDHAEMAIEVAEGLDFHDAQPEAGQRQRFEEQVIAVVHDMAQETNPMLLTESELKLGKTKPYWIPDSDCVLCMLCSVKFSLIVRRHHCRACGRVLCAACCNERATLAYLGDDEKKNKQRVCQPCLTMLDRIKEYENAAALAEVIDGGGSSRTRGVLKSRPIEVIAAIDGEEPGPSSSLNPPPIALEGTSVERKRSVVFRDGIRPGDARVSDPAEQSAVKALKKKPSRKRVHVTQKLASLKLEEEMVSFLPKEGDNLYIIKSPDGTIRRNQIDEIESRLKDDLPVEIILKRNLSCVLQRANNSSKPAERIFSVSSRGFFAVGIDEMVYIWSMSGEVEENECKVPTDVLQRISEMFESCLEVDGSGVRTVISRLPSIHSSSNGPSSICSTHILVYRPSIQETRSLSIQWPPHPFVIGISLHDKEFIWALASPNRLLLRLGLLNSWYPCPLINVPGREPVYGTDTNNTVLKVFTDFREWSYRMPNVPGSSVILKGNETLIRIPYLAKQQIKEIVETNSRMIAWQCGIAQEADSHLVCVQEGHSFTTQILAKGHSRQVTGATFVIFDSGLKSAEDIFQVTIVEDGIAVRLGGELLEKLVEALAEGKDWQAVSLKGGGEVRVQWKASRCFSESSHSQLLSPIDGLYLGDHFQYGLSLSRALSTAIQVNSSPDYTIRLSHVFHMGSTRIPFEDEAKIFSVAEMMARESAKYIDQHVAALMAMGIDLIAIRCLVSDSDVSLDISQWNGLEQERAHFATSMDQLLPILYGLLEYLPGGVHLEIHLSIVSSKDPLPFD